MNELARHAEGLKDLMIILAAAGIAVPLCRRARVPLPIAFLLAGMAVGPHGLGGLTEMIPALGWVTIPDPERISLAAEFGVVFLLFTIGLELSLDRVWSLRRLILGVGLAQVLLTAGAVVAIAAGSGAAPREAVVVGLALAMSSTAIVVPILVEERRFSAPEGRLTFSVLLLQDLMVVPVLVLVGVFARGGDGDLLPALGLAFVKAVVAVAVIVGLGRTVVGPLFRSASAAGGRELFMAMTLLAVFATALATGSAGLSMPLGAFLAGLLLAESEYRHQVEVDVEPFKGILLGVFFMSVGMTLEPRTIAAYPIAVVVGVLGLFVLKAVIVYCLARLAQASRGVALETGLLLAHAGEFAFVVLTLAVSGKVLPHEVAATATAIAVLGMAATPFVATAGRRLVRRLAGTALHREETIELPREDAVVVGGFGRVGQAVARILAGERIPYVAIDRDPACVRAARAEGQPVVFGDASHPDMLARLCGERPRAIVVTVDESGAADRMVHAAAQAWPEAPILARAPDFLHAAHLRRLGATDTIAEAAEASLQLSARLLDALGYPEDVVARRIDEQRASDRARYGLDGQKHVSG